MMEVVLTTGAISRAKLQSYHHHQETNIQFFTGRMPFLLPNQQCQSTEGKKLIYMLSGYKKHSGKISRVESSGNVLEFSGNPATASLTVG